MAKRPTLAARKRTAKAPARPRRKPAKQSRPAAARTPATPAAGRAGQLTVLRVGTQGAPKDRYEVRIGAGSLVHAADGLLVSKQAALLVIDAGLPRSLIEPLLRSLDRAQIRWGVRVVEANEAGKSLTTLESVLVEAARLRLERRDAIIALGGGIVTDLAGFAAAVYRRGVRVIQCPTTLLAMVDASVGGKTAANLTVPDEAGKARLLKNLVGAFHQPARVQIDTDALASLAPRELRSGMAECVKHGLLGGGLKDPSLLAWTEKHVPRILALDRAVLAELVARNVALKARVVATDERELSTKEDGGRMMLNLGHTFAHAIETMHGLAWRDAAGTLQTGSLKHGEAVGLGLLAATRVSTSLRLCEPGVLARVDAILAAIGLPRGLESMPPADQIMVRMQDDKKTDAGRVRLILPIKGARARVRDDVPSKVIAAAIEAWASPTWAEVARP